VRYLNGERLYTQTARFEVSADGRIDVHHTVERGDVEKAGDPARLAACYRFPSTVQDYRYYGLGPGENYPDRLAGAWMGVFEGDTHTTDLEMYSTLQESGTRMGLRWLELADGEGIGFRFEFPEPYGFSFLPYTQRELASVKHAFQLPPSQHSVLLINGDIRGLGNKFSDASHRDILGGEMPFTFSYSMRPLLDLP
jgi:beta-galactosidase